MTSGDRVEDLLSAYLAARETDSAPRPEDLCRDCPELLPELRGRIAAVEAAEGLFTPASSDRDTATFTPTGADGYPSRLGDYVVRRLLGAGGMGAVLLADDPALGRRVAVKVMHPRLAADPAHRGRFLREARAAAAIRHDHACPIYHVGEEGGAPFLVMPLLEGESLAARLARGPLPPAEAARVGREAALGLAAAHDKGLVHRDVKPANLWLEAPAGRVLVLDFGLARAADGDSRLTASGAVFGTPAYMAPERADGRAVDARADLFALGATLCEAATGKAAFRRPTLTATLVAVANHHPPPSAEVNPSVPAALSDLIARLLAKDPADRPPSAAAVADALAPLVAGTPSAVAPTTDFRPARRNRWPVRVAALVILIGLGVGLWAAGRPSDRGTLPTTGGSDQPAPVGAPRYHGSVDVYVYRKDDTNSDRLVPLWDPRAMPLKPGDQLRLIAEVNPPAFLYVFWIDEKGEAVPAYPWRFGEWGTRPAAEAPADRADVKWPGGEALKIDGPNAGTETVLMLARPTRLEAGDAEVQKWFAGLRPVSFQGDKAKVWFEDYDVLHGDALRAPGKAAEVDGPRGLQAELRRRIGPETAWSRAVSFSRRGAE
jgi:serine/threonine protein kinase